MSTPASIQAIPAAQFPGEDPLPCIPAAELIRLATDKAYEDLHRLAHTLARENHETRREELLSYIHLHRARFLRIYVAVKWQAELGHGELVNGAREMLSIAQTQKNKVNEAQDRLFFMHGGLFKARQRPYEVAAALDVLVGGTYSRLPRSIALCGDDKDPISLVPLDTPAAKADLITRVERAIRLALLTREAIPTAITACSIRKGCLVLACRGEFRIFLTLEGEDPDSPWVLRRAQVSVAARVGEGVAAPQLDYRQLIHLRDLMQKAMDDSVVIKESNTATTDSMVISANTVDRKAGGGVEGRPLLAAYLMAHEFCMSLAVEVLAAQAQAMAKKGGPWHGYLGVRHYPLFHTLDLMLWKDGSVSEAFTMDVIRESLNSKTSATAAPPPPCTSCCIRIHMAPVNMELEVEDGESHVKKEQNGHLDSSIETQKQHISRRKGGSGLAVSLTVVGVKNGVQTALPLSLNSESLVVGVDPGALSASTLILAATQCLALQRVQQAAELLSKAVHDIKQISIQIPNIHSTHESISTCLRLSLHSGACISLAVDIRSGKFTMAPGAGVARFAATELTDTLSSITCTTSYSHVVNSSHVTMIASLRRCTVNAMATAQIEHVEAVARTALGLEPRRIGPLKGAKAGESEKGSTSYLRTYLPIRFTYEKGLVPALLRGEEGHADGGTAPQPPEKPDTYNPLTPKGCFGDTSVTWTSPRGTHILPSACGEHLYFYVEVAVSCVDCCVSYSLVVLNVRDDDVSVLPQVIATKPLLQSTVIDLASSDKNSSCMDVDTNISTKEIPSKTHIVCSTHTKNTTEHTLAAAVKEAIVYVTPMRLRRAVYAYNLQPAMDFTKTSSTPLKSGAWWELLSRGTAEAGGESARGGGGFARGGGILRLCVRAPVHDSDLWHWRAQLSASPLPAHIPPTFDGSSLGTLPHALNLLSGLKIAIESGNKVIVSLSGSTCASLRSQCRMMAGGLALGAVAMAPLLTDAHTLLTKTPTPTPQTHTSSTVSGSSSVVPIVGLSPFHLALRCPPPVENTHNTQGHIDLLRRRTSGNSTSSTVMYVCCAAICSQAAGSGGALAVVLPSHYPPAVAVALGNLARSTRQLSPLIHAMENTLPFMAELGTFMRMHEGFSVVGRGASTYVLRYSVPSDTHKERKRKETEDRVHEAVLEFSTTQSSPTPDSGTAASAGSAASTKVIKATGKGWNICSTEGESLAAFLGQVVDKLKSTREAPAPVTT